MWYVEGFWRSLLCSQDYYENEAVRDHASGAAPLELQRQKENPQIMNTASLVKVEPTEQVRGCGDPEMIWLSNWLLSGCFLVASVLIVCALVYVRASNETVNSIDIVGPYLGLTWDSVLGDLFCALLES